MRLFLLNTNQTQNEIENIFSTEELHSGHCLYECHFNFVCDCKQVNTQFVYFILEGLFYIGSLFATHIFIG